MNIIVWLAVGGLIGWQAGFFVGADARQGILLNVMVAIMGAASGGWLLGGLIGTESSDFSVPGVLASILGAVSLLVLVKFLREKAER